LGVGSNGGSEDLGNDLGKFCETIVEDEDMGE